MDNNCLKEKFVEFLSSLVHGDPKLLKNVVKKFEGFSDLIHKYNNQFGLISDNDLESIWIRHFQDSLMAINLFPHLFNSPEGGHATPKRVIDIGSGAGFPGVPLSILNPSFEFILLEPSKKRGFFLEQILVRSLNLSNVRLVRERSDSTVKQNIFSGQFDLLVTRAVSSLDEIMPTTLHFLKVGGAALYFVSASVSKEDEKLNMLSSKYEGKYLGKKRYCLDISGSEAEKAIILIKKL